MEFGWTVAMSNHVEEKNKRGLKLSRRQALQGMGVIALSSSGLACGGTESAAPLPAGATTAGTGAAGVAGSVAPSVAGRGAAGNVGSAPLPAAGRGGSPAAMAGSSGGTSQAGAAGTSTSAAVGGGGGAGVAGGSSGAGAGGGGGTVAGTGGVPSSGAAGMGAAPNGMVDFSMLDCIMTPEMTEGPFFVDESLNRSDLVTGETAASVSSGVPLKLTIGLFRVSGDQCTPLQGASVDIWHADVEGVYSGVPGNFLQEQDTTGKNFLRGYQTTDASGVVSFNTIYPGWYGTRAVHIHFKVRVEGSGRAAYEFTSQMFFDEAMNDQVMAMGSYNSRGERMVRNMNDQVFNGTGVGAGADPTPPPNGMAPGADTLVKVEPLAAGSGYSGVLKIGVMMS